MSATLVLLLMTFLFLFFGYLGVPVAFSLLAGVIVEDVSAGSKAKTDAMGRFVFRDLKAGRHLLRVTYEGKTQEQAIELGPNPETRRDVDLQFKLKN